VESKDAGVAVPSVFLAVTVVSLLAAASVLLIRPSDLTDGQATGAIQSRWIVRSLAAMSGVGRP
jgi:hypothetical protein